MSQMRRDRSGVWACPDDIRGRDRVTLDEGNAMGAQETTGPKVIAPTGDFDRSGHHDKDNPESILGILATPARLQGDVERPSDFPLMTGWWTMRGVRTSAPAIRFGATSSVSTFDTGVGKWLNESRTTEAHLEDPTSLDIGKPTGPEDVFTTRITARQDPIGQGTGNGNMHSENSNQFVPAFDGEKIVVNAHGFELPPIGLISDLSKLLPAGQTSEGSAGSQPCFWVVMRLTDPQGIGGHRGTAVSFRKNRAEDLTEDFVLTTRIDGFKDLTLSTLYRRSNTLNIKVPLLDIGNDLRLFSGRMERDQLVFKISDREFVQPTDFVNDGRPDVVNFVEACRNLDMEMHEIVFTTNVPNDLQIARLERYFHLKFPTMVTEFDNGI